MFYNIAVVGFGLAGRLAALELSKQHQVTVFEADDEHTQNSAGKVAAAMLAQVGLIHFSSYQFPFLIA